jgi:predicted SnoaL-like aldol condensation-catalyzing enzyme
MHALAIAALIYLAILAPTSAADLEANKRLYRNFIEDMWNNRQPSAAECYLAPNFIEHNANLPPGLAGRIQLVTSIQAAFSDYHAEILEIVAEGNMLVTRVQWTGTQDGPFLGRPRPVTSYASRRPTSSALKTASSPSIGTWSTAFRARLRSVSCPHRRR